MQRVKLDLIDRRILNDLQADGRMTNVDLAQRVGISAPPCLRRVRALEEAGYIKGYHADLNPQLLGYGVTVFAMVGLNSQAEHDLVAFEQCLDSGRHRAAVQRDVADGIRAGVTGTPAFFVNGRPVSGVPPADSLVRVIEEELARVR